MNIKQVIHEEMNKHNLDAMLIYSWENRYWFSKFRSTAGYLLILKNKEILYLDGRYITAGKKTAQNVSDIKEMPTNSNDGFMKMLITDLKTTGAQNIGFESNFMTYSHYQGLNKILKDFTLVPFNASELRKIKTDDEIISIEKACSIADNAFDEVLQNIKAGMTEKDVENIILNSFMKQGAEKQSFDTIIASGIRGAMPHGLASNKVINNGELVTIDFGCIYNGYCSDTTRTIAVGKNPDPKLIEIYNIVFEAQKRGIEAIKPGVSGKDIDLICRNYIKQAGYEKYFTHSTGHGVGIEIHEFPRVSPFADIILEPGMVITVEPGIYIPDLGGVRIEDDILVTQTGYKVLTHANRNNGKLIITNN